MTEKKFGKSEEGAIWLNADKLRPYHFYQYLYSTPDADVGKLLRMITFMEMEEILAIEASMKEKSYVPNSAQKRLAEEVTRIVHGEKGVEEAQKMTSVAAPGSETTLDLTTLETLAAATPELVFSFSDLIHQKLVDVLIKVKWVASKSEARRLIASGGVYLNNVKVEDENCTLLPSHVLQNRFLLIGIGKKKKAVITLR